MNSKPVTPAYDVIVVGAGLGGLTAGALLSKRGYKVILLEQHNIPGGCATTFDRKNYRVEVGLNQIGGLDEHDVKLKIFQELEVIENVKFLRLRNFYKFYAQGFTFTFPNELPAVIDKLKIQFEADAAGIEKYFRQILRIRKQMNRFCAWTYKKQKWLMPVLPFVLPAIVFNMFRTVDGFLNSCIKNTQLRKLLLANLAYYHDDPGSLSLLYYAAGQGEYYRGGAYYIQRGSQELSNYLASVIEKNGGEIKYSARVKNILTEGRKVKGVGFQSPGKKSGSVQEVYGRRVVMNAAIPNLFEEIDINIPRKRWQRKVGNMALSHSFFMVFLVFEKPLRKQGEASYATFINSQGRKRIDPNESYLNRYNETEFYFCDYSQLDAQLGPDNMGQGVICCADRYSNWAGLTEQIYHNRKEKVARLLINRLIEYVPEVENSIVRFEAGTPKTIRRFTGTPEGAVYGFAQTPDQAIPFRQSVKSPVKNLYFASAWAFPGGGFTGAMISGYTCANAISGR